MYTELYTDGLQSRTDIHAADSWIFDDQTILKLDEIVVKNGDYIQSTCVYNSQERDDWEHHWSRNHG